MLKLSIHNYIIYDAESAHNLFMLFKNSFLTGADKNESKNPLPLKKIFKNKKLKKLLKISTTISALIIFQNFFFPVYIKK